MLWGRGEADGNDEILRLQWQQWQDPRVTVTTMKRSNDNDDDRVGGVKSLTTNDRGCEPLVFPIAQEGLSLLVEAQKTCGRNQWCRRRQAKSRRLGLARVLLNSTTRSARLARRKICIGAKLRVWSRFHNEFARMLVWGQQREDDDWGLLLLSSRSWFATWVRGGACSNGVTQIRGKP